MGPVSGLSMVCTWRRHLKEPNWMLPLVLWQLKQAPKTFYSQTERFAVNIALHIFSQSPDEAVSCFLWTVGLRKNYLALWPSWQTCRKNTNWNIPSLSQMWYVFYNAQLLFSSEQSRKIKQDLCFREVCLIPIAFFITWNFSCAGHAHVTVSIAADWHHGGRITAEVRFGICRVL